WAGGGMREEGLEVLHGELPVAALDEQEREPVVRAGERGVDLQRLAIRADRLLHAPDLRERDGEVLQDLEVVRSLPQREPVGRHRRVEVPLTLQHQRLVEIIEALPVLRVLRT